eukprot:6143733-Amphidinium_carterae.1
MRSKQCGFLANRGASQALINLESSCFALAVFCRSNSQLDQTLASSKLARVLVGARASFPRSTNGFPHTQRCVRTCQPQAWRLVLRSYILDLLYRIFSSAHQSQREGNAQANPKWPSRRYLLGARDSKRGKSQKLQTPKSQKQIHQPLRQGACCTG